MNRYLFVIDYQNDFVDGALGFAGAEKLDEKIAAKVRAYGKGHVLFTRDTHFENYLTTREGRNLPVPHCIKGTPGWQVYGETAKALAEVEAPAIDKLVFGMDVTDPATAAVLVTGWVSRNSAVPVCSSLARMPAPVMAAYSAPPMPRMLPHSTA